MLGGLEMKSKANGQIKVVVVAMGPPRIMSSVIDDLCHWELLDGTAIVLGMFFNQTAEHMLSTISATRNY